MWSHTQSEKVEDAHYRDYDCYNIIAMATNYCIIDNIHTTLLEAPSLLGNLTLTNHAMTPMQWRTYASWSHRKPILGVILLVRCFCFFNSPLPSPLDCLGHLSLEPHTAYRNLDQHPLLADSHPHHQHSRPIRHKQPVLLQWCSL